MGSTRVDRWLWAVRMFKTRSEAAGACKAGHVSVNGKKAKPATSVAPGDRVEARVHDRERVLEVLAPIAQRVGAKIAVECYVDHSPPPPPPREDQAWYEGLRDAGAGRPTKRDRREMERLKGRRTR